MPGKAINTLKPAAQPKTMPASVVYGEWPSESTQIINWIADDFFSSIAIKTNR